MTARKPAGTTRTAAVRKATVPAGAKLPEDHKPAAEPGKLVVTYAGKKWTVDVESLDDIEFLEHAEQNHYATCGRMILGDKQWAAFKEAIRDPKTGKSPVSTVVDFINAAGEQAEAGNS